MADDYDPQQYWSTRLADDFSLRGTGHRSYSEAYNRWLYRQKQRTLRSALRSVPAGSLALDVGSGTGWVVAELLRHGLGVEGSDIVALSVERLREQFPVTQFHHVDITSRPLPSSDASFDVVTMLDVAYHITDDAAWEAALAELARVTRPGAKLIVTDGLGEQTREPAAHVRFRTRRDWAGGADRAGFDVVGVRPYFRWLSRDRGGSVLDRVPDGARGAIEYALERTVPLRAPHMRIAELVRR